MRTKRPRLAPVPAKYRRYRPDEWTGGWSQWVTEREAWNEAAPSVLHAGSDSLGRSWRYWSGPLGDTTDEMVARREARMLAATGDTGEHEH